jgi:hypothetical protein
MDEILEFGSMFDWISPVLAMLGNVAHGGGYTFLIPMDYSAWTGREIERFLRGNGINTWGAMIVDGIIMITTEKQDAALASYLLEQSGIFVENPPT